MAVTAIDHIQLAMPPGGEADARAFYEGLLGIPAVAKPASLQGNGGCWFERGAVRVHMGVEEPFVPARKAHPAFMVDDLRALSDSLMEAGHPTTPAAEVAGMARCHVFDPFGNRVELMQRDSAP